MPAGKYDLVVEQGTTFRREFRKQNADGTPFNLTGWTARMQVRRRQNPAGTPLLDLTNTNGGLVLNGPAGSVTVVMSATQTAALPAERAIYDLELVAAGGDVERFIHGNVLVLAEVTR